MFALIWFIIKLVFWVLLSFALFHAVVTHFLLWFELRLKSLQSEQSKPLPLLSLLKSFFIETCCNFLRFFLLPFIFLSSKAPHSQENRGTPILFVHGYLQNQTDWCWIKQQLKTFPNIGPLYTINLFSPFSSILQHADRLKTEIDFIKTETKQNKIILIGHSMGGLVASYYNEFLAKPNEVEKIITLGSPFQGTRVTAMGFGDCVKEMSPHSAFLNRLTQKMSESSTAYYHIGSKIDNMIIPWYSAFPCHHPDHLLSDKNKLILEDHGHLRLLISPVVVNQMAAWILDL